MSCWDSATATWRSRTSKTPAASRWAWPPTNPNAGRWMNGSASAWPAWERITSFPTSSAATRLWKHYSPGDGRYMESKYKLFDRSKLLIKPLSERQHDMQLGYVLGLDDPAPEFSHPQLAEIARRMLAAKRQGAARILMMGAHVIKQGMSRHIIGLINRGFVSHIAMNGAGAIHDYELARIGATTESVARYIQTGEFGLWKETGDLNEIIEEAAERSLGLGEN